MQPIEGEGGDPLERLVAGSKKILERFDANEQRRAERAAREPEEVESVPADAAHLARVLGEGGRAVITVRSKESGQHVSVLLVAKKRKSSGSGFISRASREGRVGIEEADVVFAEDPALEWPDSRLGSFDLRNGRWRRAENADPGRAWAAEKAVSWALGRFGLDAQAEVFIQLRCSYCGRPLTDPVSVERGVGPECFQHRTGSKAAPRS